MILFTFFYTSIYPSHCATVQFSVNRSTVPSSFDRGHLNSFRKSLAGNSHLKILGTKFFFQALTEEVASPTASHASSGSKSNTLLRNPDTFNWPSVIQRTVFTWRHQSAIFAKATQCPSWGLVEQWLRKHLEHRIMSITSIQNSSTPCPPLFPVPSLALLLPVV